MKICSILWDRYGHFLYLLLSFLRETNILIGSKHTFKSNSGLLRVVFVFGKRSNKKCRSSASSRCSGWVFFPLLLFASEVWRCLSSGIKTFVRSTMTAQNNLLILFAEHLSGEKRAVTGSSIPKAARCMQKCGLSMKTARYIPCHADEMTAAQALFLIR